MLPNSIALKHFITLVPNLPWNWEKLLGPDSKVLQDTLLPDRTKHTINFLDSVSCRININLCLPLNPGAYQQWEECSELVVLSVFDHIILLLSYKTLVGNVDHFPTLSGMIGLDWWTKLISPSNLVHTNATTKRDHKLVPFRVHDCQIEYKLMSHYNNSQSVTILLTNLCFLSLLLQMVSKGDSNLRTILSYHS